MLRRKILTLQIKYKYFVPPRVPNRRKKLSGEVSDPRHISIGRRLYL